MPKPLEDDSNRSTSSVRTKDKCEELNAWIKALILHYMNDDIISLYKDYKIVKELYDVGHPISDKMQITTL